MLTDGPEALISLPVERALRWAAVRHGEQVRRGSGVPYVAHPVAVALILQRAGFPDDVVIAGLLHDLVEDTATTLDEVRDQFGPAVADWVGHCSEIKTDEQGRKRPWLDRKRDHLDALASAPNEAKAIILADKLHNLLSIRFDLEEGRAVWSTFHADRAQVLWYYRTTIETAGSDDPRLRRLADECERVLAEVEALGPEKIG